MLLGQYPSFHLSLLEEEMAMFLSDGRAVAEWKIVPFKE
jgi:hypothetical protein